VKYIQKAGCPRVYSQWCATVAGTNKADWREVPPGPKDALLSALIQEQGALCAYTMKRVEVDSAHVEHIKPQSRCRVDRPESDLNYNNLVACFPRENMGGKYRYGAQKKGDWWEDAGKEFVSPLHPSCEKRFRFDLSGNISAVNGRSDGLKTIAVLGLDHPSLIDERKRAVEEFVYGPVGSEPLSQGNTLRAQQSVCMRDRHGQFRQFCDAIRDALEEHLTVLQRRSRRRKVLRRNG
jgi:uncharacterized protein (TIGR02646 family)